jgi:hypothetical protein
MKIDELLNEQEHLDELFGWFKKDPAQQMIGKYLPGFMQKWNEYMSLAAQSGKQSNDPVYRTKVLGQMIAHYTKPTRNDLITLNKVIKNAGANITNDKTIEQIASQAIALALQKRLIPQKQKAKKAKSTTTAPAKAATPRIPAGHSLKFGGVDYVWNGSEWRNGNTGAVADAKITAALNAHMGVTP